MLLGDFYHDLWFLMIRREKLWNMNYYECDWHRTNLMERGNACPGLVYSSPEMLLEKF